MAMQPRPSGETFRPCLPRLRCCMTPSFTAHGLYRTWMTLGLPDPSVPALAPGVEVRQHDRNDQQCPQDVADRRREHEHRIATAEPPRPQEQLQDQRAEEDRKRVEEGKGL